MPQRYSSAVVLGASMSGLLVARALSRHFERVTIVGRDVLPARGTSARACRSRPTRTASSRAATASWMRTFRG